MNNKNVFIKVWGIPALIALLSFFGLLSALIGDNFWDLMSWITLGIPAAVMIWYFLKAELNNSKQ